MSVVGGDLGHYIGQEVSDAAANLYFSTRTYKQARGYLYYDSATSALKIWDGASWLDLTHSVVADGSGNVTISGKLTVTGLIDPTGLTLDQQASVPGGTPISSKGTIWMDSADDKLYFTNNTTTYDLTAGGGGSSPWQRTGTVINPVTSTDDVAIGTTSMVSSERMRILNDESEKGYRADYINTVGGWAGWTGFLANPQNDGGAMSGSAVGFEVQQPASWNTPQTLTGFKYPDMATTPGQGSNGFVQNGPNEFNAFIGRTGFGYGAVTGTTPRVRVLSRTASSTEDWELYRAEFFASIPSSPEWTGFNVQPRTLSGGTVDKFIGYNVTQLYASGIGSTTYNWAYGLYIEDLQGDAQVTVTAAYGIYQAGANDLNHFEGPLQMGKRPLDPTGPVEGDFWYNSVSGVLKYRDSSGIQTLSTGTGSSPWSETSGVLYPTTHATDDVVIGANTMSGSERLRVVGDARVEGKLTVTGLIDPTGLVLAQQASDPASTGAGEGTVWVKNDSPTTLWFTDSAGSDIQVVGGSTGTPWTESPVGTIYPTTYATDDVIIGANSTTGTERLRVNGDVLVDDRLGINIVPLSNVRLRLFSDGAESGVSAEQVTSGNVAYYSGFLTSATASAGDTLSRYYGFRVLSPTITGTLTEAYGLRVESLGASTSSFGIYQAGSGDDNYFAGHVGIGTTTPAAGLLVVEDTSDSTSGSCIEARLTKIAGGTLAIWRGIEVDPYVNAGTVSTMNCITLDSPAGGGTILAIRGLYIPSLKTGPAAGGTVHGIFQSSSDDPNRLEGQTGIGGDYQSDAQLYVKASYTGTIGTARYGVHAKLEYYGSSTTLSDARVVGATIDVDTGETIISGHGLYVESPTGNGTIANCFGVYIAEQETGPTTAGYGVYQIGAGDSNLFSGSTIFNRSVSLTGIGTDGYLRLNRLTTVQRDAITPLSGMVIFNTTTSKFQGHDGTAWRDFH